jgi:hypothetical protein
MEKRKFKKTSTFNSENSLSDEKSEKDIEKDSRWINLFFAFVSICLVVVLTSVIVRNRNFENNKQINKQVNTVNQSIKTELIHSDIKNLAASFQEKNEILIDLESKASTIIEKIRSLKNQGTVIETDAVAQIQVKELQQILRKFIPMKYGSEPYTVEMKLRFPSTMPDFGTLGENGRLVFTLAPLSLSPYSTYYFLKLSDSWKVN